MKGTQRSHVVKASISLEAEVFNMGRAIAKQIGYTFSFSAYVNELIKKDIQCRVTSPRPQSALTPTS